MSTRVLSRSMNRRPIVSRKLPPGRRLAVEALEDRTLLSTYTVVNTNDTGAGSFRQAIVDANANVGLDTIAFNIGSGVKTITPKTALPTITDPVVIDGTTQPGSGTSPRIVLSGSKIQSATGLDVTGGATTIRNLAINGFSSGIGIHLQTAGGNFVTGNFIGTNSSGTSKVANGTGVKIDTTSNTIGGTSVPLRNLISGNTTGVWLSTGGGNVVQGNYIGTNASGTSALGNSADGVIVNSANNTVGGNSLAHGNLISGNGNAGVNLFSAAVTNVFVRQNFVGTNAAGNAKIPNRIGVIVGAGVAVTAVGGGLVNEGNLISGNSLHGVYLNAVVNGIRVGNNLIGTDITGTVALGNGGDGIFIDNATNITVGGPQVTAGNTIAASGGSGVHIRGAGSAISRLQGNRIGTDITGTVKLPNFVGVTIESGAQNNTVGGLNPNFRNIISGNFTAGIVLVGTNTTGNLIQGNYVGLNSAGSAKLANGTGITVLFGASNNTIGGTSAAARNLISGNSFIGVSIAGPGSNGNLVQGNSIGTNAAGTVDLGNGGPGVAVAFEPLTNTVGGTTSNTANIIAFNSDAGVYVNDSVGVNIRGNSIRDNGDLGIDLENDGNNNQPAPTFTEANAGVSGVVVAGEINAAPNTTYTIELFSSNVCDPSGFGEGETFRGSTPATTDSSGSGTFTAALGFGVATGQFVTATATDPSGNTSEFSECRVVVDEGPPAPIDGSGPNLDAAVVTGVLNDSSIQFPGRASHAGVVIRPQIQRLSVEAFGDEGQAQSAPTRPSARISANAGHSDAMWLEWSKTFGFDL